MKGRYLIVSNAPKRNNYILIYLIDDNYLSKLNTQKNAEWHNPINKEKKMKPKKIKKYRSSKTMIWLIRTHLKKLLHATAAIFQKKIPYCVDLWQCTTAVSIPCWSKIYSDNTFCRHLNLCMSIFFCNISKYHLWYPTYEYIALQFLNIMLGFYWFKKNRHGVLYWNFFYSNLDGVLPESGVL